jgi:peptidyl-prolyl cis-trans isomerase C
LSACSSPSPHVQAEHASLGGDTVARVGSQAIPVSLVGDVTAAERADPPRALAHLIEDALAAAGARAAGLDKDPDVVRAITAAEARVMVAKLHDAALAGGPPTDAEVNDLTAAHWLEVDVPERLRVIHAVVVDPKKPALEGAATSLAAALLATEHAATGADDFEHRAADLPHEGLELKVERLDPFVADGRIASRAGGTLDLDFVRGAAPLAPGGTSAVVRSVFGWHVIRMIERLPERKVPFEERRRLFHDEVVTERTRRALDGLLDDLGHRRSVSFANGVDEMMADATMSLLHGPGAGSPGP